MKLLLKPILASAALSIGLAHAAEVTVVNFGRTNSNAQKAAYVEPFQTTSGNKVIVVEYNGELAKVKAMVEAGKVSWDVVDVESGVIGRACEDGLLEKIDTARSARRAISCRKRCRNAVWVPLSGRPCWPTTPTR